MNSLRLVESVDESINRLPKEETKAQIKAREAKEYFVQNIYQIAADFEVASQDLDLAYKEYYCASFDQDGNEISNPDIKFEGFVVYEPNKDQLSSEWQPFSRIIFGNDGEVYCQPQEYDKSPAHQQKCFLVDEIDKYELKKHRYAYKFLEFIRDMTLDEIEQSRKKVSKLGECAIEQVS